jgi:CRP-like cAMP-binding protein
VSYIRHLQEEGERIQFLKLKNQFPLFSMTTVDEWEASVNPNETTIAPFVSGEVLQSFQPAQARIGLLVKGSAAAFTHDKKIVRKFTAPHLFGLSALFALTPSYPTEIIAACSGEIFWLQDKAIQRLLQNSPGFLQQYLQVTSEKLIFLNAHIDLLLYESARERIEAFLIHTWKRKGNPCYISYNRTEWAQYLGISRASLYRELHALEGMGWIEIKNKEIYLTKTMEEKRNLQ